MSDYTLGDTIYLAFTTRAFATGVPTALAGSPTLEIYENDSVSPIVEGASKLVLTQNLNSINGFNLATITATTGNGFEAGKNYHLIVKTGTVGGTSVVGEVVSRFTLNASAAFTRLGAPAGASVSADVAAVKVDTAAILVDTGTTLDARIPAALVSGRMDSSVGSNLDKTGYALSSAGLQAIWDALTSALVTVGSVGKLLVDNVNAAIASRSSHTAADVWAAGTRVLTAGTNIALAKGVGVTGLNDLDAAGIRSAVGLASANLDTQIDVLPTAAETATSVWAAGARTLTSFGTLVADTATTIWAAGTRVLTAGTNIVLAKGVGLTGMNDLDAAGVRTATGLASANLDTQLSAIVGYVDTEVASILAAVDTEIAAIKAKTDQFVFTIANQVDSNALTGGLSEAGVRTAVGLATANLDTQLSTIDDFLDTEIAAIKAKTDQLVFTIANQVDSNALSGGGSGLSAAGVRAAIGLASANLDTQLTTIDDFLDTEIAAIKAKTDTIGTQTLTISSPVAATGDVTVIRGDSYVASDSTQIDWARTGWINLTGVTLVQVSVKYYSSATPVTFTASAPVTGTGSQTVRLELTATQTATLENGAYDIQVTLAGKIHTLLIGKWIVTQDVTP